MSTSLESVFGSLRSLRYWLAVGLYCCVVVVGFCCRFRRHRRLTVLRYSTTTQKLLRESVRVSLETLVITVIEDNKLRLEQALNCRRLLSSTRRSRNSVILLHRGHQIKPIEASNPSRYPIYRSIPFIEASTWDSTHRGILSRAIEPSRRIIPIHQGIHRGIHRCYIVACQSFERVSGVVACRRCRLFVAADTVGSLSLQSCRGLLL